MLDMDGVCCNWDSAALKTMEREELIGHWTPGVKNLEALLGLPYDLIWKKIDAEGSKWWRNLKEYPWFWDFYNYLTIIGDVVFCTSPSYDSNSLKGKLEWLQDRFGRDFRNYIFTNKKYYATCTNAILIDDNDTQCQNFVNNGGKAILFPQPWNKLAQDKKALENKVDYVRKKIDQLNS